MKHYISALICWFSTLIILGIDIFFVYLAYNFHETGECRIYNLRGPYDPDYSWNCDWKIRFDYKPLEYECEQSYSKCGDYIDLLEEVEEKYTNVTTIPCYYNIGSDICQSSPETPFFGYFLFIILPLGLLFLGLLIGSINMTEKGYKQFKQDFYTLNIKSDVEMIKK